MGKLNILPILKFPCTYDNESKNCVEMTVKVYNAMRELQIDYEKFIHGQVKYQKDFEHRIVKIMRDYITSIDMQMDKQNLDVSNAVEYMTTNLSQSITELLNEMKNNGELDEAITSVFDDISNRVNTLENTEYVLEYEEDTENLKIVKRVKDGE